MRERYRMQSETVFRMCVIYLCRWNSSLAHFLSNMSLFLFFFFLTGNTIKLANYHLISIFLSLPTEVASTRDGPQPCFHRAVQYSLVRFSSVRCFFCVCVCFHFSNTACLLCVMHSHMPAAGNAGCLPLFP